MLIFTKLWYTNFLGTGNVPNVIELNKYKSTVITGKNGEGKSTFLDALMFVLFDRPFRDINKPQLVNSINKKKCLVEVEFNVHGRHYRVKRGIKPNVFDIYVNGDLLNQDAASKDYQKVLEQQILKMNAKTFSQVVILGSASFTPFMQLKSGPRREVVEDLLDIRVFSVMSQILKDKVSAVKDQLLTVENDINNHRTKIQAQKKLIEALDQSRKDAVASLQQKIDANTTLIHNTQQQVDRLVEEINELQQRKDRLAPVVEGAPKIEKMKVKAHTAISNCQHSIQFFDSNDVCPSCSQEIDHSYKDSIKSMLNRELLDHQAKFDQITTTLEKLSKQITKYHDVVEDILSKNLEMTTLNSTINLLNKQNMDLVNEANAARQETTSLADEKQRMKQYAESAIDLVTQKSDLLNQKGLHDVAQLLLKDTGVKTAIIREYLPVMNKLINRYLSAMDFFVKFELDESFDETIKSRHRDVFTYNSFSEGQKRRIDLAILFTWRQIAKMKNSVNTNLMILDEILDGSLDANGIDYFMSMMNTFGENTNIFVISHRDVQDKFDHNIRVEMKNDFSVIVHS